MNTTTLSTPNENKINHHANYKSSANALGFRHVQQSRLAVATSRAPRKPPRCALHELWGQTSFADETLTTALSCKNDAASQMQQLDEFVKAGTDLMSSSAATAVIARPQRLFSAAKSIQ